MKDDPISGERMCGEGILERGARVNERTRTHTCTYVSKGVYATRAHTYRAGIREHTPASRLRAWRTKAPGKRKDVVKKTTGERAGDAARPAIVDITQGTMGN